MGQWKSETRNANGTGIEMVNPDRGCGLVLVGLGTFLVFFNAYVMFSTRLAYSALIILIGGSVVFAPFIYLGFKFIERGKMG
jgi:hypothetical protein